MKARGKHSRTARLVVVLAAVVVLTALLAAPAMATPFATSLTATPTTSTVTFGDGTTINAILMDTTNAVAIGGEVVRVEQATSNAGPWSLLNLVTSDPGPYATGEYSLEVTPLRTMYYRFVFQGTATYAAVTSNFVTVKVKPVLGKPTYPSSVNSGHKFTVKGSVKPGRPTGPAVHVKAYRKNSSGHYVSYKTYDTTISGSTYKARIKINKTGKYKFKATTGSSARFAANETSLGSVLTIKP